MATKKISELTKVTSVQDTDLLVVETSEGTRSVKKSDFISTIINMINKIIVPTKLSELADDSTHRLVTDTEKSAWNAKANSSHNQAASTITAGTFAGQVAAPASTAYTTNMIRNIVFTTTDPSAGVATSHANGSLIFVYE